MTEDYLWLKQLANDFESYANKAEKIYGPDNPEGLAVVTLSATLTRMIAQRFREISKRIEKYEMV